MFFNTKNLFSPRKGHFCSFFECLPLFLLSLFWPPPCSISLSLSLSLVLVLFSSFLSLFFAFFWFLVFVSFLPFLSSLLFHERDNIKIFNCKVCLRQYFLFSNPFFLSLLFSDFKLCFLFNINVFGFKKPKLKNNIFW